jgi:hypothetical protein
MNKTTTVILSAATAALFHMNLVAHPGHDHAPGRGHPPAAAETPGHSHTPGEVHDHAHPHAEGHSPGPAQAKDGVRAPADLKELWGQINLRTDQLKEALEKGDHDKLHEVDESLSALLRALSGRSDGVARNDRRRVQGQVNNLLQILERIHTHADAGNMEAAQRQGQVLMRTLPLLARHYPEDIAAHKAKEVLPAPRERPGHEGRLGHSH